jgi:branched-chain amino acid transport system permease protein
MVMVIIGGVGRFWGGTVGAAVFILVETVIEHYTIYWQFGLGVVLLVIVLAAPQGIVGLAQQGIDRLSPSPTPSADAEPEKAVT